MTNILCAIAAFAVLVCTCSQASAAVSLSAGEGIYGMVTRPLSPGQPIDPVTLKLTGSGSVTLSAVDIFDRPVAWKQTVTLAADVPQTVPFSPPSLGFYHLAATVDEKEEAGLDLGIIPPSHPGVRKDSFFCSNSWLKTGEDLRFLQAIGMKVQRTHFQNYPDAAVAENSAHDTWVLPIVGYSLDGHVSEAGKKFKMYGPPDDIDAYIVEWEKILRHYPDITTYEFWNEPWIYGWTWAGTPELYREFQKKWLTMAKRVNPKLRIVAGNSWMFVEDHVEGDPSCWKGLLDGTSHHPYQGCGNPNQRSGENARSLDAGALITRRMGLPYYYLTEGGVEYAKPIGDKDSTKNNIENARNLVTYFVRSALSGAFQGNAQWDIGYGPAWPRSNTTYAVMTHFLEDRPVVAEIWPSHEMIEGAVFASPKFITDEVRALPRASELSARWNVAIPDDRASDTTKVAVVWALTGSSNDKLDTGGELTIANPRGVTAYTMVGQVIPAIKGKLVVPLTANPVYITTDTLSVTELRDRIRSGRIDKITPLNLYALSLTQPADQPQDLSVRVENQLNADVTVTLALQILGVKAQPHTKITIPAGELNEVKLAWPGVAIDPGNRYGINLVARLARSSDVGAFDPVVVSQAISVARFVKRTVPIDGSIDSWQGVTPVTLLKPGTQRMDLTEYYLNPNKPMPATASIPAAADSVHVYTAYDDQNVYVTVDGWGHNCTAGQPWRDGAPFRKGVQNGLDYLSNCGDYVQIAFGFRDRVPGYGRQMGDPWAWKGQFYDTDYLYSAHASTDGPVLVREWGPDTTRRTAYQLEEVPGTGPVPGARIRIVDKMYWISIPRSELALFDPVHMDRFRFSILLNNGAMSWGETAGVFDHWIGAGSFGPSWQGHLPNQTFFGIEK